MSYRPISSVSSSDWVTFPSSRNVRCVRTFLATQRHTIRYDTIVEFNVDSKAEYTAKSSTRSQKIKQNSAPVQNSVRNGTVATDWTDSTVFCRAVTTERWKAIVFRCAIFLLTSQYAIPFGRNLRSNVSDAQINRGWITLGQNLGVFPLEQTRHVWGSKERTSQAN